MAYCTVQDIRDEGVPSTGYGAKTDAYLTKVIDRVCKQIDKYTNNFFESREMTLTLDGSGKDFIMLNFPIISITSIKIGNDFSIAGVIDLEDVRIYNRHLTQNLTNPDDRLNPKIEFINDEYDYYSDLIYYGFSQGKQNVQIIGKFGYTDYSSSVVTGITPTLINRVAVLMTLRDMYNAYSEQDLRDDAINRYKITELKTRHQTIKYGNSTGSSAVGIGPFTGDMDIDGILLQYCKIGNFGAM